MTNRFSISSFALAAAIAFAGTAWTAFADDTDPMTDPPAPAKGDQGGGKKKREDGGFLSGPAVPPGAAQGGGSFGAPGGKRQGGREGPGGFMAPIQEARHFREALGTVMPDLTEDQRTQVETLSGDFQAEVQEWRTKNADQIKKIEEASRSMRGGKGKGARAGKDGKGSKEGGAPADGGAKPDGAKPDGAKPGGDAGANPKRPDPKMMEQAKALKATMPKFEPVREKIMAVLSADQQTAVKGELEKLRKKGGERGPGKGRDGAQGKAPPPADPPKGDYKFAE